MSPLLRVGIVGGGQLGRMMIYRARKLGMEVSVLDESISAPAAVLADRFVQGSLYDPAAIRKLAEGCDVITYEIEHIDADVLSALESEGIAVRPSPAVLKTIQDKWVQKRVLRGAGVSVPRFAVVDTGTGAPSAAEQLKAFGLPCVQKARKGGYDGRGVLVVEQEQQLSRLLPGETMVEELITVRTEVAVIIARATDGALATYPLVGMKFRSHANVLEWLEAPAEVDSDVAERLRAEAVRAVEAIGGVGIFAVELFVDTDGRVLVNEIAPRPHNSGHFSIEACITDQFEQHLRAICGLPLGDTTLLSDAVMINLLGEPGSHGRPVIEGLDEILSLPGVQFHWYGKAETRANRKMGHVTVLAADLAHARLIARRVQDTVRIRGEYVDD